MARLTKHATTARLGKHEQRPITRENVLAELREAARAPGSPVYAIRAAERAINLIGRLSELVDAAEAARASPAPETRTAAPRCLTCGHVRGACGPKCLCSDPNCIGEPETRTGEGAETNSSNEEG